MDVLNGLSFDIEDWFQVENLKEVISCRDWDCCDLRVIQNTRKILRLLDQYQTRATFFILGWIAERCPSLVKEIDADGHEIASHGYGHELVYELTPEEFYSDIERSKKVLESITGRPVLGYRAPSFSITPKSEWALGVLKDLGFAYDSSIFPTSFHKRYGFNGVSSLPFRFGNGLLEIPLSTYRFGGANFPLAGGGYFRLFPYGYFRHFFQRLNKQGKPIVFYLHPWELDPGQPRLKVRLNYRLRHYVNLEKTEKRLERLLREFRFVPLSDILAHYFPLADDTETTEFSEASVPL
jgi:polysaccharide deacetylase family protein (PEP-CTERM system associated)